MLFCVIILLQLLTMSDNSETVEDAKKGSLAEVTDDSCTLEFSEIVPLDRLSDDYHTSEFIHPVVEVKREDLQEMKQEPADENDNGDSHCYVKQEPADESETVTMQVSSACIHLTDCCNNVPTYEDRLSTAVTVEERRNGLRTMRLPDLT